MLKMTGSKAFPKKLRTCLSTETRQSRNLSTHGPKDAKTVTTLNQLGLITVQCVIDAFSSWIIIVVSGLKFTNFSLGKQLPRIGELQILFALYTLLTGRSCLQHDNYCCNMEPSHLQKEPIYDEFRCYTRYGLIYRPSGLQCMELVLSFDGILYY
jgi:hypothetical protein